MNLQRGPLGKRLEADVTGEGTFPGVGPHMGLEIMYHFKSLPAHVTHVTFVLVVLGLRLLDVLPPFLYRGGRALITNVQVKLQVNRVGELSETLVTVEHSSSVILRGVSGQLLFRGEAFLAGATLVSSLVYL